jgi:hypothetical protein
VSSSLFENTPQDSSNEHLTVNGVVDTSDAPLETVGGLYDPGPSFSEDERPAARLSQMPAWLQTFAAAAGEPDEDASAASLPSVADVAAPVLTAPTAEEAVTELPNWLAEERATPAGGSAAAAAALAVPAAASLISEDDLPEWLRAISPIDDQDAVLAFGAEAAAGANAARQVLAVPSIGRAWTLAHDRPALSEGASMFALMARESVATALPAPSTEAPYPTEEPREARLPETDSLARPTEPLTTSVRAAGTAATDQRRRWMVYALALVLVILMLVVVRMFM